MERLRSLAVLLLLSAALGLSACTPQELGEFFNDQDLRSSEEPTEAAAGHVAEAIAADRSAQQLVTEGLAEKDKEKLLEARDKRPRDPRYPIYLAALTLAEDGNQSRFFDSLFGTAKRYISERNPEDAERIEELYKQWGLVVMGALDQALSVERSRSPIEPDRIERLQKHFCFRWDFYIRDYGPEGRELLNTMLLSGSECENT